MHLTGLKNKAALCPQSLPSLYRELKSFKNDIQRKSNTISRACLEQVVLTWNLITMETLVIETEVPQQPV